MSENNRKKSIIIRLLSILVVLVAISLAIFFIQRGKDDSKDIESTAKVTTEATTEEPTTVNLSYVWDKKYHTTEFHAKQVIGRVSSDDLGINCNLVFGTTDECLSLGAGFHKCSSLPGLKTPMSTTSTCPIIAGHCRTVFEGFSKIDPKNGELPKGLTITLEMPYGNYTYEIISATVGKAKDFQFSEHRASYGNFEPDTAIFYTCYPFGVVNYIKTDRLFMVCKLIEGDELVDDTITKSTGIIDDGLANGIG
ncbi:MAG: hypothetical protein MJ143_01390 [Clostridia bacterium]|nr:hypothetical protein [Clostridia bacterium]